MTRGWVRALTVVLVAASMALVGCDAIVKSGIEKATGVKVEGDKVSITKDGENVTLGTSEEGRLPDGFPSDFPMYSGSTVTGGMSASSGDKKQFTVTANVDASLTDVKDFYVEKLQDAGWDVKDSGSTTSGGSGAASVNATKGEDTAVVQIVQSGDDAKSELIISLELK